MLAVPAAVALVSELLTEAAEASGAAAAAGEAGAWLPPPPRGPESRELAHHGSAAWLSPPVPSPSAEATASVMVREPCFFSLHCVLPACPACSPALADSSCGMESPRSTEAPGPMPQLTKGSASSSARPLKRTTCLSISRPCWSSSRALSCRTVKRDSSGPSGTSTSHLRVLMVWTLQSSDSVQPLPSFSSKSGMCTTRSFICTPWALQWRKGW
mmetsp:Transcript_110554/g.307944  ORF Transcript_110554/g.307944 Transcript_110554/m.307944 type:complete len:214 (+) Transcript_110554:110-751(+)